MGTTQQTHTASSIMPSVLTDGVFVHQLIIADDIVDGEFARNCNSCGGIK